MLESLIINNGKMSPKFTKNNFIYTIYVNDVNKLDIEYIKEYDKDEITIMDNENLSSGENIVKIYVNDNYYTLYVYKESEKPVNKIDEYIISLNANNKKESSKITAPLIGSGAFIIILIFFYLLFHKSKN